MRLVQGLQEPFCHFGCTFRPQLKCHFLQEAFPNFTWEFARTDGQTIFYTARSVSQGSGRQGPPSTQWRDTQHSTWSGGGGVQQLTQFSLSWPLCSSVSGSQASSHHSVGIKWAAEAEGYEKSQCLEQVRKFHLLHWCLAQSLSCTDSGGINMLLTNPLIISHVILL